MSDLPFQKGQIGEVFLQERVFERNVNLHVVRKRVKRREVKSSKKINHVDQK